MILFIENFFLKKKLTYGDKKVVVCVGVHAHALVHQKGTDLVLLRKYKGNGNFQYFVSGDG